MDSIQFGYSFGTGLGFIWDLIGISLGLGTKELQIGHKISK